MRCTIVYTNMLLGAQKKVHLDFLIFEALKEAQQKIKFVTTERREEVI